MAKPLTRLVRFLFHKVGYDLQRLQKTHLHREALAGHGRGGGFDAFEATAVRDIRSLDIYVRSCARVDVFGQSRTRFIGVPKCEVVVRCLRSIVRSVAYAKKGGLDVPISLTLIDDHSDPDCVERMKSVLAEAPCRTRFVALKGTGVGASLTETYTLAREEAKDLIYIAADDYLHEERAILESAQSYGRIAAVWGQDPVLFPSDYPDRYKRFDPTFVLLGSHRHWMQVPASTGADVLSIDVMKTHWDRYMAFGRYGVDPSVTEENTINLVLAEVGCFAPLPSLAVHFQHYDTLSPYFDWKSIWEANA